jgi:hypothetical protein
VTIVEDAVKSVSPKELAMDERCGTCRFWIGHGPRHDAGRGFCQRYAPRPIEWHSPLHGNAPKHDPESYWPTVSSVDWCGEWKGAY